MSVSPIKDSSGAVLLCHHVAKEGKPILRGRRDEPVSDEDSGWQFRCNAVPSKDIKKAQIWSLQEVLQLDPSLRSIVDLPHGKIVERRSRQESWIVSAVDAGES
jgi:hypothetical protein